MNQFAMPTVHTASINSHTNITSQLQLASPTNWRRKTLDLILWQQWSGHRRLMAIDSYDNFYVDIPLKQHCGQQQ